MSTPYNDLLRRVAKQIDDLYGALLMERMKQCQQSANTAPAEAGKKNGRSTMREVSSSRTVARSAGNGSLRSIGQKS